MRMSKKLQVWGQFLLQEENIPDKKFKTVLQKAWMFTNCFQKKYAKAHHAVDKVYMKGCT